MAGDTSPTLGEFLRQERERRGISIEQVASATKINIKILHALEEDHYHDLPAKPFVRGFVTSYARFVNLDAQEILTRFNSFLDEKTQERPARDSGHSGYAFEKREGEQTRTVLWFIMGGSVILGALILFVLKPALRHHKEGHIEKLRAANVATPTPAPSAPSVASGPSVPNAPSAPTTTQGSVAGGPSASPVASAAPASTLSTSSTTAIAAAATAAPVPQTQQPSPSPNASLASAESAILVPNKPDPLNSGVNYVPSAVKNKIIIKALEDVWVRYQVDNKPIMKFPLRKERILVLRGNKLIRFQVSNPKSVTFNLNGRGNRVLETEKTLSVRQETPTLFIPAQVGENIEIPFPGETPLPKTPNPKQPTASEVPAATL